MGSIPGLGRVPGEGNSYPLQYSGLENSMNREAWGFPLNSVNKESTCSGGDPGLIPGLGRSLGEGNGNPVQYSCLGNPMDRGAWQSTVLVLCAEVKESESHSVVFDSVAPWTVAHQAPLSMDFSKPEYWSG